MFSSHPGNPEPAFSYRKRSQQLPRLSTRDEDLCLQLLNTSTLQIFILSKKSINIFNHAVKDHIRRETHWGKGITLHRQPWICHCLAFPPPPSLIIPEHPPSQDTRGSNVPVLTSHCPQVSRINSKQTLSTSQAFSVP